MGYAEAFGGPGEASVPDHRVEVDELPKFHTFIVNRDESQRKLVLDLLNNPAHDAQMDVARVPVDTDGDQHRQNAEGESALSGFSTYDTTPAGAHEQLAGIRERCPVAHSDRLGGFHILLRYDDVKSAAMNWGTFSSRPSAVRPVTRTRAAIDWDPPEHTGWRKVINLGVNPTAASRIEELVREDAARLIDAFATRGHCDLVAEYAEQLPLHAICHVLGFDPEHKSTIRRRSRELLDKIREPDGVQVALRAFAEFAVAPVLERRGKTGDDFLTLLANAEMGGRPMSVEEMGSVMVSLLGAGHETTVSGLSSLLFEVLRRPEIRDRLIAEPDLIPIAVEEALRLHPPIFGFYRRATTDVNIEDVEIAGESTAYLCWAAANRDPEKYSNPHEFNIDRPRVRHLTFGHGIHACPGASIARMEMCVAASELLKRLPDIHLKTDDIHHEFGGSETMSIRSLPALFVAESNETGKQ